MAKSDSGNEVVYLAEGTLPGASAGWPILAYGMAHRTGQGWVNESLDIPDPDSQDFFIEGPRAFNVDFSESLWMAAAPPEDGPATNLYRRSPSGTYSLVAQLDSAGKLRGASRDLRHLVVATSAHLLPGDLARTSGESLYEVSDDGLKLVDVDDGGNLISTCGSTAFGQGAMSADGRRVFFTSRPSCTGPVRAYVREDGQETKLISASHCTLADCGAEGDATIAGVTPDGTRAFFVTTQRLTNDDADTARDLYAYDVESESLELLSAWPGPVDIEVTTAPIQVSADGSRAAFYAAEGGSVPHLFVTAPTGPRLVAESGEGFSQFSPDGRFLLFESSSQVTDDDSDLETDVYRYEVDAEHTIRVSAGPLGGNGPFAASARSQSFEPTFGDPHRSMSDDGSELFFATSESLLPEDHNADSDIYEWASGQLSLVSAGVNERPSYLADITPDGSSVFFTTTSTLLPADRDGGDMDVYAARAGGGFPEGSPGEACADEACPLPPARSPSIGAPSPTEVATNRIRLRRPGREDLRRVVRSGWITVLAEVPRAGRLSIRAWAKIGSRRREIAAKAMRVARPGVVRARLRIARRARQELKAGGRLPVVMVLALAGSRSQRRIQFDLGGAG